MERHPKSGKPILNKPDAQGFYTCQYTQLPVKWDEAIFLGPCVPQVSGTYVCHPSATPAHKQSKRLFDEHEANCNTCKHLVRKQHNKRKDGQLLGQCHKNNDLLFHPEDHMGMVCYEQRQELEKTKEKANG